jgi:hypothetical protein
MGVHEIIVNENSVREKQQQRSKSFAPCNPVVVPTLKLRPQLRDSLWRDRHRPPLLLSVNCLSRACRVK